MTNERYVIREGCSQQGFGTSWWAVVAYKADGTCLGADAHWLSRQLAENAKAAYEKGLAAHGVTAAHNVQIAHQTGASR
jgi:hypothetical protein